MTEDEQTALSRQHSHGVWVVLTVNDTLAVFDHPNGKLIRILNAPFEVVYECRDAAIRYKSRDMPRPLPASLDLGELEIDL